MVFNLFYILVTLLDSRSVQGELAWLASPTEGGVSTKEPAFSLSFSMSLSLSAALSLALSLMGIQIARLLRQASDFLNSARRQKWPLLGNFIPQLPKRGRLGNTETVSRSVCVSERTGLQISEVTGFCLIEYAPLVLLLSCPLFMHTFLQSLQIR